MPAPDHHFLDKNSEKLSKEALTHALLEAVRLAVLALGEHELPCEYHDHHIHSADSTEPLELQPASSEHTSSDMYLPGTPRRKAPACKSGIAGGPCANCGATDSPQWRRHLTNNVVLCNACGIYYRRHHSLPKRKKAARSKLAVCKDIDKHDTGSLSGDHDLAAAPDGSGDDIDMIGSNPPHHHEADSLPQEPHHELRQRSRMGIAAASAADHRQELVVIKAEEAPPFLTPASSVSIPSSSVTLQGAQPAHDHSGTAALHCTTRKRRTDAYLDALFAKPAQAEDSSTARRVARPPLVLPDAAAFSMRPTTSAAGAASPSHAVQQQGLALQPAASVSTSAAGCGRYLPQLAGLMEALIQKSLGVSELPATRVSGQSDAASCIPVQPAPTGSQQAAATVLLPTATCRGPRLKASAYH